MPHTDPSVFLSAAADIIRAAGALLEWAQDGHSAGDLDALFPGADVEQADLDGIGNAASNPSVVLGTSGSDTLSTSADKVLLYGAAGDDTLTAGPGDVLLSGGSGNDVLTAGAGVDVLYGGPGNDRLDAGAGDDFVVMSAGNDLIIGGLGNDTLVLGNGWAEPLSLTLTSAGPADTGGTPAAAPGSGVVVAVENVVGGAVDDAITGSGAANVLFGMDGDDRLDGAGGVDVLDGGTGADVLTGGPDADMFRFQASSNDVITDYSQGEGDVLQLSGPPGSVTFGNLGGDLLVTDADGDLVVRLIEVASSAQVTIDFLGA